MSYSKPQSLAQEFVYTIIGLTFLVLALLALEHFVWSPITFMVSLFFFVMASITMLAYRYHPRLLENDIEEEFETGGYGGRFIFGYSAFYFITFVLLSRSIWLNFGAQHYRLIPVKPSFLTWLVFGLDHSIRVVLFDFPETFGISLSQIEHSHSFWMSSMVFIYRFSLSLGIIKVVAAGYKRAISS